MNVNYSPKISVIMAGFNEERFLVDCLESLKKQSFFDFELIVINDCSSDHSLSILLEYQKNDSRIIIVNNEKNIGLTRSLNRGLNLARGKYIARVDADDLSLPFRLEKQFNFLENNPEIFLVGSGVINIDEAGRELNQFFPITDEIVLKNVLIKRNAMCHVTIMFRNDKNVHYRDKFYYSQDYDLYLNLLSGGKRLVNLPDALVKYRQSGKSVSFGNRAKQKLFARQALEFFNQRQKLGIDQYDQFDPRKILNMNIEHSCDKKILQYELDAAYELLNFDQVRDLSQWYFKNHGYNHKVLVYYLSSFVGRKACQIINRYK